MVFPILDTPRTEAGDMTRLSAAGALDFTTENSIPSPSKESNDLLRQIRGMRAPNRGIVTTPRARQPLVDRRNVPSKTEFTPLLKSATRNRGALFGSSFGKENGPLRTPDGLKASYHGRDSPALPLSSSIMEEQYTGSFLANESNDMPAMPVSSSAVSTPMAVLPGRGEGPLDHGNMATLREQEARLEQIDKENFSLKLKIHFMEEALRRNGKEFNEAAIKENTELKVDKVTLQRDLKHYRRLLAQAEKDLEDYKRQLLEYAEKVRRRHADAAMTDELDELRRNVSEKEDQIHKLEHELDRAEDDGYNKCNDENRTALNELRDTIADLEAELRDKDRQLDEHREEIDTLKESQGDNNSHDEIDELKALLQDKEDDIKGLHDALHKAGLESDAKLREKDRIIERKDDELRDLEDQLKNVGHDQSFNIRSKDQELQARDKKVQEVEQQLEDVRAKAQDVDELKNQLHTAENSLAAEVRKHSRAIEEKDYEIHALEQKLESSTNRDGEAEKLHDQIADLEADVREKERLIDQREDEIEEFKSRLQQLENETDDELIAAQDRIQELEIEQERNMEDLKSLRDSSSGPSNAQAESDLATANARISELEEDATYSREEEQRLQKEIDRLRGDLQRLEQSIKDQEAAISSERQAWLSQRQSLEFAKAGAEKQAEDLRKTIAQLQQIEGSLSGKESQLQKMLEMEQLRHEQDEGQLRKDGETQREALAELRQELEQIRKDLKDSHNQEQTLQEKVVDLEEEVEVLQGEADDELERVKEELESTKMDYRATQTELELLRESRRTSTSPSSRSTPSPQRDLQRRVLDLETQLLTIRTERDELQEQVFNAESVQTRTRADLDNLQLDLQNASGPRSQWQQKLQEAQTQLVQLKKDKRVLEDEVATGATEFNSLQTSYKDLETSHSTVERQLREVRAQLTQLQREGDRKLQTQVAAYEHDIHNLEQDLVDAEVKHADLVKKYELAENSATRQRGRMATLEAEIAALRNATGGATTTSPQERRDLHEMLKDAKLDAEDLALQLKERDTRLSAASAKESELRAQLRRAREDRTALASRADADTVELEQLRSQVAQLETQTLDLRTANRKTLAAAPAPGTGSDAVARRHAAELKGLARQIEYLSARCRREEAFRADLGFVKTYFQKTVAMYGRCNALDLKLVRAMGVPTAQVLRDERRVERLEGPGRVALAGVGVGRKRKGLAGAGEARSRPTLKVVGLMVLAGVRMERMAESWGVVRGRHEELLQSLRGMRAGRDEGRKRKAVR